MSALLWKAFLEDDFENFRQLLDAAPSGGNTAKGAGVPGSMHLAGSPGRPLGGTSPNLKAKNKPGSRPGMGKSRQSQVQVVTRSDINARDGNGITLLHMAASSTFESARRFAQALLGNPLLDLYIQDRESNWTALHRALYAGNVSIARELMDRDISDFTSSGGSTHAGGLIKIKDREGNSPFDVYAATIAPRTIPHTHESALLAAGDNDDEDDEIHRRATSAEEGDTEPPVDVANIDGDEIFMFGSNKNLTLGFGDEDDRHFPERITLRRPSHLLDRFRLEHAKTFPRGPLAEDSPDSIPANVRFKALQIQDVQLAKLSTAILTTDPESNLYMCGFGPGGRLGTGDQSTRFKFTSILGGGLQTRKIIAIALGQDHTLAVTLKGEVFSWGGNKFGQLGYAISSPDQKDEDPMQLLPRQVFGPLKRELVKGCAASRVHSAVFTNTSLFTFGKNEGQLGLVDSDARLLEQQTVPRKVAASLFSSGIQMVSAIDKATACLLENHDVWIFANYGYRKVQFPLSNPPPFIRISFSATSRQVGPNYVVKIRGGGDTICALAHTGEVFNVTVSQKIDPSIESTSTTNPSKIRGALSAPQQVWSLRKSHMAAIDVDVGQDGSIILCTHSGSVWRRTKRAKIKDSKSSSDRDPTDYKFSRVPGLTYVCAVRANAFGAFAAVRMNDDVLKEQIEVGPSSLWQDMFPLLSFSEMQRTAAREGAIHDDVPSPGRVRRAVLTSEDVESDLASFFERHGPSQTSDYDVKIGSTVSDVRIPCHQFVLMGRSGPLRRALATFKDAYFSEIADLLTVEYDSEGIASVIFQGLDVLCLLNITFYLYTDGIIDVWNIARKSAQLGPRFRQVRVEVMKAAAQLDLRGLERAARLMAEPAKSLHHAFDAALAAPEFLESGDIEVHLEDGSVRLHSALVCRRCPFFEALFHGRASGGWLESRRQNMEDDECAVPVDLEHVNRPTFLFVVRYLYGDVDEALFEDCVHKDLDEFLDLVLDVLAIANELMIDRLAQICQKALGRHVNLRNICWLLNAVSPCAVKEFKNAALESICLNLEGMLENRLLDELEDDLVLELGEAVRANQLACLPIGRGGYNEARLFEEYPELVEHMARNKQTKIDYMALQSHRDEDEVKIAKLARAASSYHELMFDMDDDGTDLARTTNLPSQSRSRRSSEAESERTRPSPSQSPIQTGIWYDADGNAISASASGTAQASSSGLQTPPSNKQALDVRSPISAGRQVEGDSPWTKKSLPTAKLDMKEIMAQASEGRSSSISAALASAKSPARGKGGNFAKPSQKERRKQQHAEKEAGSAPAAQEVLNAASPNQARPSPWRVAPSTGKVSLREELSKSTETRLPESRKASGTTSLTMRQTIPGNVAAAQRTGESSASAPAHPHRSDSSPIVSQSGKDVTPQTPPTPGFRPATRPSGTPSSTSPIVPKSIRHIPPPALSGPSVQLSMSDILAQQQIEKQAIREATAKRSLQEIQEEQAFQEWWDQEEAATKARMEEEAAAAAAASARSTSSRGGSRGRSSRGGKGRGRGGGASGGGGGSGDADRGSASNSRGARRRSSGQKQAGPNRSPSS